MSIAGWTASKQKTVRGILIFLILIYPLVGAFLGLDLGDTGYHLYAYTNLTANPDKINYTTYLSSVVGWLWNQLFGGFGLIAFNLLEVLLEWALALIIYCTFRKELGKSTVLLGILFAIIASDTYLNIFNYHQFNAFLMTIILCLEYKALMQDRKSFSMWAGVFYVLAVFSRVGSVIAIVTLALYIYYAVMYEFSWKETGKHLLSFLAGMTALGLILAAALKLTGRMDYFIANIFRLGGIAADESSAYGFGNLLDTLIRDNLKVIASGLVFYGAAAIFACGLNIGLQKCETRLKKAACILLALFVSGVALYQMQFAYDINPAENWPQMTTGQRFVLGVMYVTAFLCFACYALRKDVASRGMTLLVIEACMLIILTIAGSNTGTKHVILGMWLLAPVCVYTLRKMLMSKRLRQTVKGMTEAAGMVLHRYTIRVTAVVVLLMFGLKFGHMVYYTFNYDSVDRTKLTATVNNKNVRGILTTQREADALNGVLEVLNQYEAQKPLMVFGNTLLFYYMTERDAYVMPWVTQTSYSLEKFQADLEEAEKADKAEENLPLVVYCRTNYAYGFEEEVLSENVKSILYSPFSGKKDCLYEFLERYDYGIKYINDYYAVIVPNLTSDTVGMENVLFGSSKGEE